MTLALALVGLGLVFLAIALAPQSEPTVSAAALAQDPVRERLYRLRVEKAERFRAYDRAWSKGGK